MLYVTVGKENATDIEIYYKDWGSGQPVVTRCFIWLRAATAASLMTATAMAARASHGAATTWTPTPTIS